MSDLQLPRQRCYVIDLLATLPAVERAPFDSELVSLSVGTLVDDQGGMLPSIVREYATPNGPYAHNYFLRASALAMLDVCGVAIPGDATVAAVRYDPDHPHILRVYVRSSEFPPVPKGETVPVHDNGAWLRPKPQESEDDQ